MVHWALMCSVAAGMDDETRADRLYNRSPSACQCLLRATATTPVLYMGHDNQWQVAACPCWLGFPSAMW